jgi:hypothetical protein
MIAFRPFIGPNSAGMPGEGVAFLPGAEFFRRL